MQKKRAGRIDALGLPLPTISHWTADDKLRVLLGIKHKLLTREEAKQRYAMSEEELASWEQRLAKHGHGALKVNGTKTLRA